MIIFHEGLPGSGKSYEAMKERIVPALSKGREVVAYVEGLDFDKIAELAGITPDRCRELLISLTREQVAGDWVSLCRDNALHVFDEAQNFWGNRAKLGAPQTQLITEHRHRGMDIILMGQDLRDVHATWRRRVELKLSFLKLNGVALPKWLRPLLGNKVGTENSYSVTTYRHMGGDEYKRLGLTLRNYDPRFFGTYKSHVSDDTNTEVYSDSRGQVWNHPLLKYVVPVLLVAAVWGAFTAWRFFHPKPPPETPAAAAATTTKATPTKPAPAVPGASAPAGFVAGTSDNRSPIERRMSDLTNKGRIRLAGLISSKDHTNGIVEWVQGGSTVVERLSLDALRALGVGVVVTGDNVVQLAVGDYREIATAWPLEDLARVSDARQATIRGPSPPVAASPAPTDLGASAKPSMSFDLPGPMQVDPDAGSLQRRVRRAAQPS